MRRKERTMDAWVWILIAAVVIVLIVAIVAVAMRSRRRSEHLRDRFGAEYDRVVTSNERAERRAGESELEEREARREEMSLRPLTPVRQQEYVAAWRDIQLGFVDAPERSVVDAEHLVNDVMRERGYPVDDEFEDQAALISVDHPDLVANYRRAHEVYERSRTSEASTDEMRDSVVYYRSLFDELLAS
jgi:flagellar basal body-associated protein FliL